MSVFDSQVIPQQIDNSFNNVDIDMQSFAWQELIGQDGWDTFVPAFTSLTVVGATNYSGRQRYVGRKCEFQVKFSAATSVASTAGTTYLALPITSAGLAGIASMTDDTAKTAVGMCHIDATNSRCYLPSQSASGHVFTICGSYEI